MSDELSIVAVESLEINGKQVPAVTSLQVAKAFGKEHFHVMRDVRAILEADEDGFGESNFGCSSYVSEQNKEMPMYIMSKDGFVLLVMGYTGAEAMRLKKSYIAKFNEMEEALRNGGYRLPRVPQSFSDALRMIADIEEAKEKAIAERDVAIRTKAEIGCRREATAMNTASQLSKENEKLRIEIGDSKHYKQVKAIPWLLDEFENERAMYSLVGRKLSEISRRLGYDFKEVSDTQYGMVKAYHVDVINKFREMLDMDRNMLRKYRIY